ARFPRIVRGPRREPALRARGCLGREPDSSARQAPAVGADRDVAGGLSGDPAGSRNHTIPANRRPVWVLAVMTHDRSRANLEVVLDQLISRHCGTLGCLSDEASARRLLACAG